MSLAPLILAGLLLTSPVDQLGFSSEGASLAGATVAYPTGGNIAMYNPALAAGMEDVHAVMGYSGAALALRINDQAHELDDARAIHMAIVLPLSLGDYGRVGATFAFTVPDGRLLRPRVLPLDRPRFLMFDNRLQRTNIDAALAYAYAFGDFEAGLGFGATVLGGAAGQGITFQLTETDTFSEADAAIRARLPLATSLTGGGFFRWRDLHAGLFVRGAIAFDVTVGTTAEIELGGLAGDVYTAVASRDYYTPAKIAAGLAWTGEMIEIHVAVETYLWSQYRDDVLTVANINFEGLPIDLPIGSAMFDDEFRDVVSPRLGVVWRLPSFNRWIALALRAGAFYEPTPVVQSELRLDSDKIGGALGVGLSTTGPVSVFPRPISIDGHFMMLGLLPRTFPSDGPSSGRPDLTIDGLLFSGGVTATVRF